MTKYKYSIVTLDREGGGRVGYNTQIHSWANATGIFTKIRSNTNTVLFLDWEEGCLCYNTRIHSWDNATGIFTNTAKKYKNQPNSNTALLPLTGS